MMLYLLLLNDLEIQHVLIIKRLVYDCPKGIHNVQLSLYSFHMSDYCSLGDGHTYTHTHTHTHVMDKSMQSLQDSYAVAGIRLF